MKYYKDENNQVYAFEADGSQDAYIHESLAQITEAEADALRTPQPPTPEEVQAETNAESRAYLASTDWYVVRFAETGVEVPAEIAAARQTARDSVL